MVALAVCLVVAGGLLGGEHFASTLSADQAAPEQVIGTIEGRAEIWSRAIFAIQDFPFTGMGMNTFRTLVHLLYPLTLLGPGVDIAHAHNTWLQVALDLGLPGLVAYASIWLTIIVMQLQVIRGASDRWIRAISTGVLGCLTGYFIYGLTDTVALGSRPGFLLWMLLALGTAAWKRTRRGANGNSPEQAGQRQLLVPGHA
jgi:putative inorganic carbon (HCO3(-)) transporter